MKIIDLMTMFLAGDEMPDRIRYNMMQEGYETFRWDDEAMEYICEGDERVTLRVPWHHLEDEVVILDKEKTNDNRPTGRNDLLRRLPPWKGADDDQ